MHYSWEADPMKLGAVPPLLFPPNSHEAKSTIKNGAPTSNIAPPHKNAALPPMLLHTFSLFYILYFVVLCIF